MSADDEVEEWGDCLPDCPTQITNPVCLMDPEPPALQDGYQGSKNYSTEFNFGTGEITKGVNNSMWLILHSYMLWKINLDFK